MVRLLLLLLLCSRLGADTLLLEGFKLVDPAKRSVRQADLLLVDGKVFPAGKFFPERIIKGNGRYLMPALWDMKASLWGNLSAKNFDELTQDMWISPCLRVHLFYGVGHVAAAYMGREWVSREQKRAQALEFPAAELFYPDKALGGAGERSWAIHSLTSSAQVGPLLDDLKAKGVPFLFLLYGNPGHKFIPGLSPALLKDALKQCAQRGIKGFVLADSWAHAAEAVQAGASAIQVFPAGKIPDGLVQLMRERHCYFAPRLALNLELVRLLGNPQALDDPFLKESVPQEILKSFLDPAALWEFWRPAHQEGLGAEAAALESLKRIADAGIPLLSSTDAGWSAGIFHGYSTHALQAYMEKAGLDPWTRLGAATSWPAAFLGRQAGFNSGDAADFVALEANPLESAANLRKISFLVRNGEYVERESLKIDLSRARFKP